MFYKFENGSMLPAALEDLCKDKGRYIGYLSLEDSDAALVKLGLSKDTVTEHIENKAVILANHNGLDVVSLSMLNHRLLTLAERVCICFNKHVILFIFKNESAAKKMAHDAVSRHGSLSYERILSTYFEKLIESDISFLDDIEQEISDLESALLSSKKRNCVKEIISLRKRLMVLKRYYEQLLNVLDELQQNENETLEETSLRYIKIIESRVERLYNSVINLRDYVTQVREAYQAEVDISLNNIMKIFTVITAVFLPLTLIVGWYGMNLQMPEFSWPLGYPMVIVLCIAVVILCLAYFKKNKWF